MTDNDLRLLERTAWPPGTAPVAQGIGTGRESAAGFALFDSLPAPAILLDGSGRIDRCNPLARDLFRAPKPAAGPHPVLLAEGLPGPRLLANGAAELARSGAAYLSLEADFATALGPRLLQLNLQQVPATDGGSHRTIVLLQDLTEQRRAEEDLQKLLGNLQRSNQDLEQFAYVASHDLQEPLRMISSYLQLLERRCSDRLDGDGLEFLHFAVDGAHRMQVLIQDLLAYSRVDRKGHPFAPTDLNLVVENSSRQLAQAIEESGAEIEAGPLPTLAADRTQLLQLFQNLIGNAIKFRGDQPPRITIEARGEADEWLFSVRDNGIGIDPRFHDRIFGLFQRLHSRSEIPGTGIGLALCKRIVERHGGRIWVESLEGKGADFRFTLKTEAPPVVGSVPPGGSP